MSDTNIKTLLEAVQSMLEAEDNFSQSINGPGTGSDIAALRDLRDRGRKLVAAHIYLLLGHLQSGDWGNIKEAISQLRELAKFLKEPA